MPLNDCGSLLFVGISKVSVMFYDYYYFVLLWSLLQNKQNKILEAYSVKLAGQRSCQLGTQ